MDDALVFVPCSHYHSLHRAYTKMNNEQNERFHVITTGKRSVYYQFKPYTKKPTLYQTP